MIQRDTLRVDDPLLEDVAFLEYEVSLLEWQHTHSSTKTQSDETFRMWKDDMNDKDPKDRTIFVCIPSYRDPECANTLMDLYTKATFPHRVHVGIFQQNERNNTDCFNLGHRLPRGTYQNVRIVRVSSGEAQGPTYARFRIMMQMFGGQDYFMSIDAHTMVRQGWDVECIRQLHLCMQAGKNDTTKPIVTTYPLEYTVEARQPKSMSMPTCIRLRGCDARLHCPIQESMEMSVRPSRPLPTLGLCTSFFFAPGIMPMEVPYDPRTPYLAFGEETLMGMRLYTAGYDFFCPSEIILYHQTNPEKRSLFWEQYHTQYASPIQDLLPIPHMVRLQRLEMERQSHEKMIALMTGETGVVSEPFGLGHHRSITDFYMHQGVDIGISTTFSRSQFGLSANATLEEQLCKYGGQASHLLGTPFLMRIGAAPVPTTVTK